MFARTKRLTLRHAWPEDAPALARAIGYEQVVTKLGRAPWPYALTDAEEFLALPRAADEPEFAIFVHEGPVPRLIGGIGIHEEEDGVLELGYWLTPDAWGRGYATEAGRAVIDIARHALPIRYLRAGHYLDNPASGRVMTKLGFKPTGQIVTRHSRARGADVQCALYALDLSEDDVADDAQMAA